MHAIRPRIREGLVFLAPLVMLVLAGSVAHGAISSRFEVGFEDSFTAGAWTPIRAELTNLPVNGNATAFRGRAQLVVTDQEGRNQTYVRSLDLPVNSRKRIEFITQLPLGFRQFEFELVTDKGKSVYKKSYEHAKDAGGAELINQRDGFVTYPTVLIINDEVEVVPFPNVASDLVGFRRILPYQLPWDYRGYDNVRLMVVRRPLGPELNESQVEALKFWLSQGGRLMIQTTRFGEQLNQDPVLGPLLPGELKTTEEIPLTELGGGAAEEKTLISRWASTHPGARVLWAADSGPVALQIPFGDGSVTAMGIDSQAIGKVAFRSEIGARFYSINEGLMLEPGREDYRARHFWSTGEINPNFGRHPMPNPIVVLFILTSFVIIVGPVNFYLLRKRRNLEAAWFTIPALSILFFIAVYTYGYVVKGNDQFYAAMDILHLKPDQEFGLMLSNGIQFSPRNQYYEFTPQFDGGTLPAMTMYRPPGDSISGAQQLLIAPSIPKMNSASTSFAIQEPREPDVLRHSVEQWSWEYYMSESMFPIDGKFQGEVRLSSPDGLGLTMELKLANETGAAMGEMYLCAGEKSYTLKNLGAGESIHEQIPYQGEFILNNSSAAEFDLTRSDRFYRDAYQEVLTGSIRYPYSNLYNPQRNIRLLARQNTWQATMAIDPEPTFNKTCSMLEIALPVHIDGPVVLDTNNLLSLAIVGGDRTGAIYKKDDEYWSIEKDQWNEFLLSAPALSGDAVATGGSFQVQYVVSSSYMMMEMFNYRSGNWQAAISATTEAYQRDNQLIDYNQAIPPAYINPIGHFVRIRFKCFDREIAGDPFAGDRVIIKKMSATLNFNKADTRIAVNRSTQ